MTRRSNYWDYLGLSSLLSLQGGLEGDEQQLMPDELHFIVVHQVYELWFKLVLRELRLARDHLAEPRVEERQVPYVVHHLRRVTTILELAVDQFRVMETLTPQDFLAFRDKLAPASGFQSFQIRELEIVLGMDRDGRVPTPFGDPLTALRSLAKDSPGGAMAVARVEAALHETSLRTALEAWLYRTPIQGSHPGDPGDDDVVVRFVGEYLDGIERAQSAQLARLVEAGSQEPAALSQRFADGLARAAQFLRAEDVAAEDRERRRRVRAALLFIESYRDLPLLAWPRLLVDSVVELEELLVLWRNRHARMVERVIGRRVGTGGSAGVDYLDQTAKMRIFQDLWTVRTVLLARDAVPPLQEPGRYGFATG